MLTYKRFVSFSVSLLAVLVIGAINALFMTPNSEWFAALVRPNVNPDVHSLCWLAAYLLVAVVTSEFFIEKKLRRSVWSVAVLYVANPLWCLVFFRLHSVIGASAIIAVALADLIYIDVILAKHTKCVWLVSVAATCWYVYLAVLNAVIIFLNI